MENVVLPVLLMPFMIFAYWGALAMSEVGVLDRQGESGDLQDMKTAAKQLLGFALAGGVVAVALWLGFG